MAFYDEVDRTVPQASADEQFKDDTIEIMRTPTGRRFMWKLIVRMGLFALDSPDNRIQSVSLWQWLGDICSDLRVQMIMENIDG